MLICTRLPFLRFFLCFGSRLKRGLLNLFELLFCFVFFKISWRELLSRAVNMQTDYLDKVIYQQALALTLRES